MNIKTVFANSAGTNPSQSRRQVVLPLAKSIQIAFQSLRIRMFRSLITTLSLVLAVSFLSFTNINTQVANSLLATGQPELRQTLVQMGFDPVGNRVENSPKQRWIVVLSLLVCVVGIVNAQLMAVTERFREIGTMKCLGALDSFVLRLFVIEAGMQGLAGALSGALCGALFAVAGAVVRFGGVVFGAMAWPDLFTALFSAVLTGAGLSLVGAIYPAWVAARMQPVEAMRTEQ